MLYPAPISPTSEVACPAEGHPDVKSSSCKTGLRKSWRNNHLNYKEISKFLKTAKLHTPGKRDAVSKESVPSVIHSPEAGAYTGAPGQVERAGLQGWRIFWKTSLAVVGALALTDAYRAAGTQGRARPLPAPSGPQGLAVRMGPSPSDARRLAPPAWASAGRGRSPQPRLGPAGSRAAGRGLARPSSRPRARGRHLSTDGLSGPDATAAARPAPALAPGARASLVPAADPPRGPLHGPRFFSSLVSQRAPHFPRLSRWTSPFGGPSTPLLNKRPSAPVRCASARVPSPVEGHVDPLFAREAQHPADHVAVVRSPAFVTHLRPAVRKPDFDQPLSHGQGPSAPSNGWPKSHLLHLQVMLYLGMGPQAEEGTPVAPFTCPAPLKKPWLRALAVSPVARWGWEAGLLCVRYWQVCGCVDFPAATRVYGLALLWERVQKKLGRSG